MRLVMLGTGCATATKCYNSCFAIEGGGEYFMVDAGGGNGILRQLSAAGISCADIRNMFVTHCHTDHLLGVIWIVRFIAMFMLRGKYSGIFTIYGHAGVTQAIKTICELTLPADHLQFLGERIKLETVEDGEERDIAGMRLTFFDIGSGKARQFGFRAVLSSGLTLGCLGDEPYNPANRSYVEGCDWLMAEAFCLYADREIFKPYEKHHSTALDAGRIAASLQVRNLLLYHTEDTHLAERKSLYAAEAAGEFSGKVFVPDDLDVIKLD